MITAIDSNVIVTLWSPTPALNLAAQTALDAALKRGALVIAAPAFAELIAGPGRTENFVTSFLEETAIAVDWELGEPVWRLAGRAFQAYAEWRRRPRDSGTRRILADFLIGAHAQVGGLSPVHLGRMPLSCLISETDNRGCLEYWSRLPSLAEELLENF